MSKQATTATVIPEAIRNRLERVIAQQTSWMRHHKPELDGVFTLEAHRQFVCATDAHIFLAIEAGVECAEVYGCTAVGDLSEIEALLFGDSGKREFITRPVGQLRDWCYTGLPIKCESCDAARQVACWCKGRDGNEPSDAECEGCGGSGKEPCQCSHIKNGVLLGSSVDRNLLLTLLTGATGNVEVYAGKVIPNERTMFNEISTKECALVLIGEGWRGLLMPMRVRPDDLDRFE